MKIPVTRLFDIGNIKTDDDTIKATVTSFGPFFDFINAAVATLVRAVSGELVLGTNVKGEFITIDCVHGVVTTTSITKRNVTAVQWCSSASDTLYGFDWTYDASSHLTIKPYFRLASSSTISTRFFVWYS
jgi:hypothetical protein